MITDAVIKWRINKLNGVIGQMSNVNNKINVLNTKLKKMEELLSENVLIDDKIAFKEYLDSTNEQVKPTAGEITGKIIPSLRNTIYKLKQQLSGK